MDHSLLREMAFNGLTPSIIEEISDTVSYIGYRMPSGSSTYTDIYIEGLAVWSIKKIETTGTYPSQITTQKWAEGSQNFNKIWSSRASYVYSYPK